MIDDANAAVNEPVLNAALTYVIPVTPIASRDELLYLCSIHLELRDHLRQANAMYNRSPELMQVEDTTLLVVDVQEKLIPHIAGHEKIVPNIARLIDGAKLTGIPVIVTEQYPKGLGRTVPDVSKCLDEPCLEKITFSCVGDDAVRARFAKLSRPKVLLCGVETHVCIQQTAFDLMSEGYVVYIALDAISSRHDGDHQVAIRRMESHGVVGTTVEACLFEWCERAGTDVFREVRKLV